MNTLIKANIEVPIDIQVGDLVRFKFDFDNHDVIVPLEDQSIVGDIEKMKKYESDQKEFMDKFPGCTNINKLHVINIDNMMVEGKFYSFSRIDHIPIFEVDTDISAIRDIKLSQILE
jgi:hypothetical protein